jgi:hypothetical protein
MTTPVIYAADFGIVIALYGLKALLFRFVRSSSLLFGCFFLGVALAVPLTWLTSPDWNNDQVYRIAIWVGDPVAFLAVPCVSFLVDFFSGRRDMKYWPVRIPVEVVVVVPAWVVAWVYIMANMLGWLTG